MTRYEEKYYHDISNMRNDIHEINNRLTGIENQLIMRNTLELLKLSNEASTITEEDYKESLKLLLDGIEDVIKS